MMEVPRTWASIINPQYQITLREFQNTVKYHEESLEKLEEPIFQSTGLGGKHWDNECQHSRKGESLARVTCIQLEDNDLRAQEDYNNLFYDLESDSEEGTDQQDFCRSLKCSDLPNQLIKHNSEPLEETSSLEGTKGINLSLGAEITRGHALEFSVK
jgi:hypothetical protein